MMLVQRLQLVGSESGIAALREAVLGGQHEMGLDGDVRIGADVDAFQSTVLSQSLPAVTEHVAPLRIRGTSNRNLACLLRMKQRT